MRKSYYFYTIAVQTVSCKAADIRLISAFARANPHLAIFVYDPFLAKYYTNPPSNVVIFRADDEETHSILLNPYI